METAVKKQYMLNYFDTLRMLQKKQKALEGEATSAKITDAERAEAAAAFLDLASKISGFKDAHEALMQKFTSVGVEPPGEALVTKTQQLEDQLGAAIATQNEHSALLKSVTSLVSEWASISPETVGRVAAGAPAHGGGQQGDLAPAAKISHLAFIGEA
ncbi:hypothetical protein Q4S45_07760 [Massilia sp. R2A-15]|uniref:hypothetical protein n=1 Tax=Massilia sp. R2A-15 TaxID=3064278 RepID=UPI002732C349|nr:hypothetical protein [Massilia sp. R2A-15]WLI91003.1 hypothetical protein Q4S45_07760 [Massilia sp. R2A-15]